MTHVIREKTYIYTCTDRCSNRKEKYIVRVIEEYMDEYAGSNATEDERNQIVYEVTVSYDETNENIPSMSEGTLICWDDVTAHIKSVFKEFQKMNHVESESRAWERGCYCEMCIARLGDKKQ